MLAALAGAFCGLAPGSAPAASTEPVSLQLKWHHQFQFAGYYAAQAKGYYQAAGLAVTILEGGVDRPPLGTVLKGEAQFGVTDSDVVLARMKGSPTVVCAVVFQHTPYVLLSRRDRNIRTPADLVGKTVMLSDDQGSAQLRAMLIREGIDPARVKFETQSWELQDLIDGRVDAVSAYATVEPGLLRARGVETSQLRSRDYGVDFYGDALFTTEAELAAHPDRVEAFTDASMKGWEYAMAHPAEIADLILALPGVPERGLTREALLQEALEMGPFVQPEVVEIGHMNPGRWQRIAETFAETGMAPRKYSLGGFIFNPRPERGPWLIRWLLGVGLGLTVLAVIAFAWSVQLRRKVRDRTGELQTQIEQRKRTEEALRASEARYRTLFEYAPDGIVIANPESYYLDANASTCRMLGYSREELVGLHASDIVHETELPHIGQALEAIRAQSLYHREWRFRRKDGSDFQAEVIATVMPDGNLLGMIRDITERKRIEARFRRLVDSNAQGVMFWNARGEITGANDAFLRIVGYTRADLEAGRIGWGAMTPPEFADVDRLGREEIAASGVCAPYEKEILRRDGTRVPILIGAAAFEDNPGEGVGFVLDLTERKKLEQQFLRAQRMESIGTLAGGIAHDLNNLLAPITMGVALLKRFEPNPKSLPVLENIERSAMRGANLVKQVMSFARGVSGAQVAMNAGHIIREVESIIGNTFPKNITIENNVAKDLWLVMADPTQLNQVLLNLCVNARDAMREGGRLVLAAENLVVDGPHAARLHGVAPGRYVLIQVTDSGCGIPQEIIDRIFEPFFTTKAVGKGTGLGLSTAHGIVRSHGGFFNVSSEPGRGSTFKVYLPALREGAEAARTELPAEKLPRGQGETILVVDDEASILEITKQTLQTFGYKVLTADDGAQAVGLHAMHRGEISVVLTDMMMPVMDGSTLITALQRLDPGLIVIAASGLNTEATTPPMPRAGVKHYLTKPYSADALLTMLSTALAEKARAGSGGPPNQT